MKIFTKDELKFKSVGELYKTRDDNFQTYLRQVAEVKAKYKALLDAELKTLVDTFNANAKLILDVAHQKTHAIEV